MSKAKECCDCAALLCFGWFLRTDGMLSPIAFPFVPPAAHFSQQLEKWAKEPFETEGFKTSFPVCKSYILPPADTGNWRISTIAAATWATEEV